MKKHLLGLLVITLSVVSSYAQTVTRTWVAPSSVTIDGVGNYGYQAPAVSFNSGDFTSGCKIDDVNVTINWAKTDGTCSAPGSGSSYHEETSFRIDGPGHQEILAVPGTWTGNVTTSSVVTTFNQGSPLPGGTPVTGTFGPNGGNLDGFDGLSPYGNWNLRAGDNASLDPLCLVWYSVTVTAAPDNTPPVLSMPANVTVNASPGQCGANVSFPDPTATDLCTATVAQIGGPSSNGQFFQVGVSTLTFQASDPFGNTTNANMTVTVLDNQNPTINCPANFTAIAAPGSCTAVVNLTTPTPSDNCPGATASQISGPTTGSNFPLGPSTIIYRATDASGNTADCSFTVTVVDNEDPQISCPANITALSTTANCGHIVTYTTPVGTDNCTGVTTALTAGQASGTEFPTGTTTVTYTTTDGSGNTDACSFTVTINPAPNGFLTINPASVCQGSTANVIFNFTSGVGPFNVVFTDGISTFTANGVQTNDFLTVTPPTSVTYSFVSIQDLAGCVRTSGFGGTVSVVVTPLQPVSFSGLNPVYCEADPTANLTGNPLGGSFSGTGVNNLGGGLGTFSPSTAGPTGPYDVTYTYTDVNSCISSTVQQVLVDEFPIVSSGTGGSECDLDYTFSASTSVGTGSWTLVSGPGSAFFNNASSPTSSVQVTQYGTYVFQWEGVNGECSDSDQVTVNFYQQPTVTLQADRSECQLSYSLTSSTNIPVTGYSWSQVSGPTALIVGGTTATATIITPGTLGAYVFELEVTVNGCTATDQITITQVAAPVANAGSGGNECDLNFGLTASPSAGVGTWTQTAGPGFANFVPNANAPNATVSVSQYGNYQFTWTEQVLNCSSSASVAVNFYQQPVANAGNGGNECDLNFVFNATPSVVGSNGMWTQIAGPGTSTFVDATNPSTTVTVSMIGQYQFQWEETNGTCSDDDAVTVNFFTQPVANPGFGGSECDLDFQLGASQTVGVGTWTASGPGTITFAPDANTPNAIATVSTYGVYIFTWTEDNFGCMDDASITVNFNQQTNAIAGDGGEECDLNFVFNASPSFGTGVWTSSGPGNAFFSNPNSPTATVTVDAYGAYLFTWTETNGPCTAVDQVNVTFYEQPNANAGAGGDECDLNFNFTAVQSVGNGLWLQTNGPGTSTFIVDSDPTTTVTVDQYGTYTYTWTETNGICSDNSTVVVNYYEQPVADAGTGGDECDLDFSLTGTGSVGVGLWTASGPGTATFVNDLSATTNVSVSAYGTYTFAWTELNGTCSDAESVTVNFYEQPVANAGTGGDECDLNFALNATASVGVGQWSQTSGPGSSTFGNPSSATTTATVDTYGTYEFTWTETNGSCSDFATITVNFYQQPVANAGSGGDECDLDFTLAASTSVGNGEWTYTGPGTATFGSTTAASTVVTVSQSGAYTFTWTETNAICVDSDDVTVNFYDQPVANPGSGGDECDLNFVFTAATSFGNGTWTGTGPGNIFFNNPSNPTGTVTVDAYGSYTFTWTEVNGICSDNASITVNFYEQPNANAGSGTNQCDLDFTLNATATVGVGTWTYTGPGTATFAPNANDPAATVTVDASGSYTFTWTEDNNGCTDSDAFTMAFNALPTVSFSGLDAQYCVNVTTPVPLTGTPTGGTFTGLGISGNNFIPSVAGVGTIFITYTYTDGNGCTDSETQTVDVNGLPVVSFTGLAAAYCEDDATAYALSGTPAGGTFSGFGITGDDFIPADANNGTHVITYNYVDPFGCTSFDEQTVVVNELPVVSFTGLSAAYCEDAVPAPLTGSPAGGTFSGPGIVGNSFSSVVAGVGTHTIVYTYTDGNGCTNTASTDVTVNPLPVPVITPSGISEICDGTDITLDAGTGYAQYDWSTSQNGQSITVDAADDYNVTVTTFEGCVGTSADVTVVVNPNPVVDLGPDTVICTGSVLNIDAGNPGATYSWSTFEVSQSINVTTTGAYVVTVTDPNGCEGTDDIAVTVSNLLDPVIVADGPIIFCDGDSVMLDAGAGFDNYLWSTGEMTQTIFVSDPGVIDVIVSDQFGCSGTDDEVISTLQLPNAVIQPGGPIGICINDTITLSASSNFASYEWNPGGAGTSSIEVWLDGSYTVTVTDPINGCEATSDPVDVTVNTTFPPTIVASGPTEFCNGGSVSLSVEPGPYNSYLWTSGSTTPSISVIETGDYGVTVLDANNCVDSTLLGNPLHVEVWDPQPIAAQLGDSVVVTNGPFATYQWFFNGAPVPGATEYFHMPAASGNYVCVVTDDHGCEGTSYNVEFTFTGIFDPDYSYDINLYPNPTNGRFTLEADLGKQINVNLSFRDITGREIMAPEQIINVSSLKRTFDISHLERGVYYIQLTTSEGMVVKPLVRD